MVKFTTSTNIVRDTSNDINYIPTPNAKRAFDRLINNYQTGHHAFNIIGSYGTGKSSFLWAFEKNLKGEVNFFQPLNGQFEGIKKFHFLKIVGESASLRSVLNEELKIDINSDVKSTFKALEELYLSIEKRKEILIIELDEFGKFLEHAAKNDPEKELYFIQQLAEFVNDPNRKIILITTLHQNFGAYAKGLSVDQKKEWDKVKGRIMDIAFDEPIEQLLYLSAERVEEYHFKISDASTFQQLFDLINQSRLLSNAEQLDHELSKKLFPFDYLSAHILAQALQKYGQNERSLFTFLSSNDEKSISKFEGQGTYHLGKVFDYLVEFLSSELQDRDTNPHKAIWKSIGNAIDKIEVLNSNDTAELVELVKVIGLINIFGKSYGSLNENFITGYAEMAMGIDNASSLIEKLKSQRIIKFFRARNKFFFQEGTDLDFEEAYSIARASLPPIENLTASITKHVEFQLIAAKRIQYEKGTPRYFEFNLIDFEDLDTIKDPQEEIDGFIHLVFTKKRIQKKLEELSSSVHPGHIFVLFKNIEEIEKIVFEANVIEHVLSKNEDDTWAQRILSEELNFMHNKLRETILSGLYAQQSVFWIHQGSNHSINDYRSLNKFLSSVAETAYPDCPTYRNEMVNKEVLSGPILTARKKLIEQLLDYNSEENIGFPSKTYPPEKTIYLSFLKETGIHQKTESGWILDAPKDPSFQQLWSVSDGFLNSTKHQKQSVASLYEILAERPFKLKKGFVDYWIPIFLIIKQQDFALFHIDEGYIPYVTSQVLDLLHKKPSNYLIKAYEVEGVKINLFNKYKEITGLDAHVRGAQQTFIKVFSNFFIFYNQLPEYTKKTKRLEGPALNLREAIKNAKDPEQALLEQFPAALGFTSINLKEQQAVESFVNQLNEAIYEIRTAFQDLIDRIETRLLKALNLEGLNFPEYQKAINKRFSKIKEHLLTPNRGFCSKDCCQKLMSVNII